MNKKGNQKIYMILMEFVVAIVATIVVISFVFPGIVDQGSFFQGSLSGINSDDDGDGYKDFQDKCPCTYGDLNGDGCPLTFTSEEKSEDIAEYNSNSGCDPQETEVTEYETTALDSGGFQAYHSVEIAGNADSVDDISNSLIYQACTGWVGKTCSSSGTCSDFITSEYGDSCWIMISETESNTDCGQVLADQGTIISSSIYSDLTDFKSTFTGEISNDAYNLLSWGWKSSSSKYGSLLCKDTFWFGCQIAQEGKTLSIGDVEYTCSAGEWKSYGLTVSFDSGVETRTYLSIELFGKAEGGDNVENKEIRQACEGYVGEDSCKSYGDDCNNKFQNSASGTSCPIMISEHDPYSTNNCGQVEVDQGTIISSTKYSKIDYSNVVVEGNNEVEELLGWNWKSKQDEYGSLICRNKGWMGCHWDQEGRIVEIEGVNYLCSSGEWIKEGEKEPAIVLSKTYQSVEIFGDATGEEKTEPKEIRQACTGWVGEDSCKSEANDCNNNFIHSVEGDSCPIMVSEDDDWPNSNDCGQIAVDEGTILSSVGYLSLSKYKNNMYVEGNDGVKELLGWEWKSKADEYGALICMGTFWYSCQGQFEGTELDIDGDTYVCHFGEWELNVAEEQEEESSE